MLISDDDIQQWLNRLEGINDQLFEATHELTRSEEDRKMMKATLMREYDQASLSSNGKPLSGQLQEREAYSDPRYREVAERMAMAKGTVVYLTQQLKQFDAVYNIWRTASANSRMMDKM
jgi:hypothetical protein